MTDGTQLPNSPSQHAAQNQPWYQKGSLPLGSCIGGIPIYLHWSFFVLLIMMIISVLLSGNASDPQYWGVILLLYGPILLVTIILHEFGHAFMTKLLGGKVGDMVLWPLGGFVICGPVESIMGDFKVAIAGPLTHLPQMAFWGAMYGIIEGDFKNFSRFVDNDANSFGGTLSAQAFFLNLFLLIFNLFVPAYPLDGGRCLAAFLILCGMKVVNAAMATAMVGMLLALALAVWGIVDYVKGSPGGIFNVFIAAWIFMTSWGLFKLTRPASGVYGDNIATGGGLATHPVFGQKCYQDRAKAEGGQKLGTGSNV